MYKCPSLIYIRVLFVSSLALFLYSHIRWQLIQPTQIFRYRTACLFVLLHCCLFHHLECCVIWITHPDLPKILYPLVKIFSMTNGDPNAHISRSKAPSISLSHLCAHSLSFDNQLNINAARGFNMYIEAIKELVNKLLQHLYRHVTPLKLVL